MRESGKPPEPQGAVGPTIEAVGLDEAGQGVARAAGAAVSGVPGLPGDRVVHVADLLPGERAEVVIEHRSPHRPEDWARIARRIGDLSPERVAPSCRAWGACGGCVWQHLAYDAQLREKRARVVTALRNAVADVDVRVAPVVPSPAELGYRTKGKYVAGAERRSGRRDERGGRVAGGGGRPGDGPSRVLLGAWAPRSHALVDTSGCRVVAPVIEELRERVRVAAEAAGLEPWDERRKVGALRYVIVRATRDRGASRVSGASAEGPRALVVLVVRSNADAARVDAVARAVAEDSRVAGVVRMDNDRNDGALLDGEARVLVGAASVTEVLSGVDVEVGAGEFAQVNPAQADAMYARVADLVMGDGGRGTADGTRGTGDGARARVADVYAGLGGITFALARAGASVVAIERDASAIDAMRAAAVGAGLTERVDARAGDAATLGELRDLDAIVVNPPRKGLAKDVVAAVVASTAKRVVYVSCGPEALGRDLALLRDGGFTVETIEPYDLMPGTAQVETIVALSR
ncbi:MAG TPA: methyltransferase [Kofleriaceae bacterium]|nr:methyltransferase [Kofleriaceae bacterium]